jgi:protein phosphatase
MAHLIAPRSVVPESIMPGYPFLVRRLLADDIVAHLKANRAVGVPYTDEMLANARADLEAQANPDLRGMGTTTSALVVKDNKAWFAHVGDSRIYLVRGDEIRQITEDHSLVASMVREGLLTPKEAETHPRRNVLQRSMGVGEDVEIDVSGPFDIKENDVFVLCSDGLHGLVKEPELKEIAALPIDQAATEYVKRALSRGAPDNVTVIVAKIVPLDEIGNETLADADETLADHPLDETQRDTAPIVPITEETAVTEPIVTVETPMQPDRLEKTVETPMVTASPRGSVLKWVLISVLVLAGAAGAWLYWNHQQGIAATTTSPTR